MTRILYDAFFHMPPGHRIGPDIAVGGYRENFGRYSPGDCYHPNGLAFLEAELAAEYELRLLTAPYSAASLFDADILLAANPDYPLYQGASPYRWAPEDVDALLAFAERGGGVLLLINSFLSRPDFWEENFDLERVGLLLDRLGIRWDANYMSDDKTIEKARSASTVVGYGQGGRVFGGRLPAGAEPLITYGDNLYGFLIRVGKGALAVIGDAGMLSNGLVCFPGFDNATFAKDLFRKISPVWCKQGIRSWDYRASAHLSGAPSQSGLNEEILRSLRPKARWIVDHHYRHLAWDRDSATQCDQAVWQKLPVSLESLRGSVQVSLNALCLDTDEPGRRFPMDLVVRRAASESGSDIHAIGRAHLADLSWKDISHSPERFRPAGEVERVSLVFEMKAVLDPRGNPLRARWSQGQFLYARNPASAHYGYEIILASASGVIAPRA